MAENEKSVTDKATEIAGQAANAATEKLNDLKAEATEAIDDLKAKATEFVSEEKINEVKQNQIRSKILLPIIKIKLLCY